MISYRCAGERDVPAILELWSVAAENASRPDDSAPAVLTLISRDPSALLIAVDRPAGASADRIVGSLVVGWDGWRCHLYRLAVHPEYRRRGIAASLLAHAESRARELGAIRMDAMVLNANDDGAALWRAAGYHPQADWSRWIKLF